MRTHESVLLANYEVEQVVDKKDDWHARKYLHAGKEVMENRVHIVRAIGGNININTSINALGSFHESQSISLTREQFEWLQEIKL